MALTDDLGRIAAAAAPHGEVAAVLAAEPADGIRAYVVALGGEDDRRWLVLRDDGQVVTRREDVRDAASIVAMCELAADTADGLGVSPGEPPLLARPGFLDELGAALIGRPEFTDGLRAGTNAVEEFAREVERGYAVPLG
jgi:hypothetical protein